MQEIHTRSPLTLTAPPLGGRGCGKRKDGGLYLCAGVGATGTMSIWDTLIDPAIPYAGEWFRGVHVAGPELRENWPDEVVLLLHWVGQESYPSVPHYFEEARRYGFSTRIGDTFDFGEFADREVWIAHIHPLGRWAWTFKPDAVPFWPFHRCDRWQDTGGQWPVHAETPEAAQWGHHYPECTFHLWPLSIRHGEVDADLTPQAITLVGEVNQTTTVPTKPTRVKTPWGSYDPLNVVHWPSLNWGRLSAENAMRAYPTTQAEEPGIAIIRPVTHVEAVKFIPKDATVDQTAMPVVVVEE